MKINNFETDDKGLIELINFLHSPKNLLHIDADIHSDNHVFYLMSVEGVQSAGRNKGVNYYSVGIGKLSHPSSSKYQNDLFNLLNRIARN